MATKDDNGADLPDFDGSTWDPFAQTLLFTAEINSPAAGVGEDARAGDPAVDLRGIIGSSAYEGIQDDSAGNLWIVEDNGGTTVGHARQPNSFVYRFVPNDRTDLANGGKLQVLQVESLAHPGQPIVFHAGPGGGRHHVAGHHRPALVRQHVRHEVDHAPRHGHGRHRPVQLRGAGEGRRRHAVQAPGERRLPPGHEVPRVRVHRDR